MQKQGETNQKELHQKQAGWRQEGIESGVIRIFFIYAWETGIDENIIDRKTDTLSYGMQCVPHIAEEVLQIGSHERGQHPFSYRRGAYEVRLPPGLYGI